MEQEQGASHAYIALMPRDPGHSEPANMASSQAVIDSLRSTGLAVTDTSFAVWQCYLAGTNPELKRAIDIVLSNGLTLDERSLRRLHERHFSPAAHAAALNETVSTMLQVFERLSVFFHASNLPEHIREARLHLHELMQDVVKHSQAFNEHVALSQERIKQLEHYLENARRDAGTDGLTGLANRRSFDRALRSLAGAAMNDDTELGIIVLDIDHFKSVNDKWGHQVGDAVLRRVAATLSDRIRHDDVVARYGGEEFAVILPRTAPAQALFVAEELRKAVQRQSIAAGSGTIAVTISAGASCYDPGESLDGWVARADAALYAAKHEGRNQTKFGGPSVVNMPAAPLRVA